MKKMVVCLMVACLSLFAYPYPLNAGALAGPKDKTEIPIIPPALEKKLNEFRKNHPDMFTKKENRDVEKTAQESKKQMGLIGFAISVGLLVVIILLIMMLV
jgi:hypothetical protein